LQRALDNGLSADELAEVITHLAFYSGWPTAASALNLLSELHACLPEDQE
jgi:4-carboxymuconolactone decarboxylase